MKKGKNLESFLSFLKKPKQMNFHISIGNGFLTSDNPVISTFGSPTIPNGFQILMPISPYLCFEFQNDEINCSDNLWVKMSNEKLRYINEATINTANYYIISNKPFNITQQMYIYNRFKNINWIHNSRHFKH